MAEITARISRKEGDENDSDRGQQLIHGKGGKPEKLRSKVNAGRSYAKTIALCIRTTKLTADVLKLLCGLHLRSHNQKKQKDADAKRLEKLQ